MMRTQRVPLIYSEGFKKRVMEEYKGQSTIKELLDRNEYFLGRYLDDGSSNTIYYKTVIEMLEKGEADKLLALAKGMQKRLDLYAEWDKEVFLD